MKEQGCFILNCFKECKTSVSQGRQQVLLLRKKTLPIFP